MTQLLAQVIIPLVLVDVLLHLIVDLTLEAQDIELLRHRPHAQLQPVHGRQRLKDLLLVLIAEGGVLGDEIGQLARVVAGRALQQVFLPGFDGEVDELLEQLMRLPHERLRARHGRVVARHVQLHRAGEEGRARNGSCRSAGRGICPRPGCAYCRPAAAGSGGHR